MPTEQAFTICSKSLPILICAFNVMSPLFVVALVSSTTACGKKSKSSNSNLKKKKKKPTNKKGSRSKNKIKDIKSGKADSANLVTAKDQTTLVTAREPSKELVEAASDKPVSGSKSPRKPLIAASADGAGDGPKRSAEPAASASANSPPGRAAAAATAAPVRSAEPSREAVESGAAKNNNRDDRTDPAKDGELEEAEPEEAEPEEAEPENRTSSSTPSALGAPTTADDPSSAELFNAAYCEQFKVPEGLLLVERFIQSSWPGNIAQE